jgi:hypothetical protein
VNSPEAIIGRLDAALARTGRTIMVRRWTGNGREDGDSRIEAIVKASVRPEKADEIVGDANQARQRVILSPTGLAALMPLLPSDRIVLGGAPFELPWESGSFWIGVAAERPIHGAPTSITIGDRVVRIELTVLG